MARQLAAQPHERDEMVRLAEAGWPAEQIGKHMGFDDQTVRNTVRRVAPAAFRRSSHVPAPVNDNGAVTHRVMPHQIGWSTDPTSHHAVSLPRLRCLSAADTV